MERKDILNALKKLKETSPKRNFKQSIDLIIAMKGLDLKKPEHQVDVFSEMHYPRGKKIKVCALVSNEIISKTKEVFDNVVPESEFSKYQDKRIVKKLAREYDFFIAQSNTMPKVASVFGRYLGPKGKMPNPKAGCVITPDTNFKALYEKLQKTIRISVKIAPFFQCLVGKDDMIDEQLAENILTVYNSLVHALPSEENNVKSVYLKMTMSPCVRISKGAPEGEEKKGKVKTETVKNKKTKEKTKAKKTEENKEEKSEE